MRMLGYPARQLTLVSRAAGATTRIESKTNIIKTIEKIRTSHYSTKMLRLPPIILARKGSHPCNRPVTVCYFFCFCFFVNFFIFSIPPKMPTSKILGGSFEPLEPPPPTLRACKVNNSQYVLNEIENMFSVFIELWKHLWKFGIEEKLWLVFPNFYSCCYNSIETRYMFSFS